MREIALVFHWGLGVRTRLAKAEWSKAHDSLWIVHRKHQET